MLRKTPKSKKKPNNKCISTVIKRQKISGLALK